MFTYLNWHLGLGDAFICSGLVRTLLDRGEKLILPTKPNNAGAVAELFCEPPSKLRVVRVSGTVSNHLITEAECAEAGYRYLGLGYKSENRYPDLPWELEFYAQAGLPLDFRWSRFSTPESWRKTEGPVVPYAFVHQDESRGFRVRLDTDLPIRTPNPRDSIGDAARLMADAEEIHCIDSCFLNLAEGMYARGWLRARRMVYHSYARKGWPPEALRAPWEVIK